MLLYRVFPYLPTASSGQPGHPLYQHTPQRGGRVDHPDYYVWYLSPNAEAACGEVFGNLTAWDDSMFDFPLIPGARRALGTFSVPNHLRILNLDDPTQLVRLNLRPTQIVTRNLAVTQQWAHRIWDERQPGDPDHGLWDAVSWWSYHQPTWTVIASWQRPELVDVTDLTLTHPAIVDAATTLHRTVITT